MIEPSSLGWGFKAKRMRMQQSMGLYVLYFGTNRQYPEVAHHTIWLGEF